MKPVLLSLPFVGHRHGPRAYGYPPQMEQVPLPFPAEAARGRVERYRALFATVAANACSLAVSVAAGVLTSEEALVVMRRHAKRLQVDLAALENEVQS